MARDAHGCADSICHTVIIDDVLFTYVPNAFTPDGDGENDTWTMSINIPDVTAYTMTVFDRWGEVVYVSNDPRIPWNGTMNNGGGEILKQDIYPYRLIYQVKSTGEVQERLGHVSLLK